MQVKSKSKSCQARKIFILMGESEQAGAREQEQKLKFCGAQRKSDLYLQWVRNMGLSRPSRSNRPMVRVDQRHNQRGVRYTGISTVAWVWATVDIQRMRLGLADFAGVFD